MDRTPVAAALLIAVLALASGCGGDSGDPAAAAFEEAFGVPPTTCVHNYTTISRNYENKSVAYCRAGKKKGCYITATGEDVSLAVRVCNPFARAAEKASAEKPTEKPKPKKRRAKKPRGNPKPARINTPAAQEFEKTFREPPTACQAGYGTWETGLNYEQHDVTYCYGGELYNGRPLDTGCYITETGQDITVPYREVNNNADLC